MAERSENQGSCNSETGSSDTCITTTNIVDFNGFHKVLKDSYEYTCVQHRYYNSLNGLVPHCPLIELRRVVYSSQSQTARCERYKNQLSALKNKRGLRANEVFGWYGGSVDEIVRIVSNGFEVSEMGEDSDSFGIGLHLNPESLSVNSLMSSPIDRNGVRHVLLCRVLLGEVEEVVRGSLQWKPSSENFDSGVDNRRFPTKYVIWYQNANKCVLPCYVLSVKMDQLRKELRNEIARGPSSPWIPFKKLIKVLSLSFPPLTMYRIKRVHCRYLERKIDKSELIQIIRQTTGDRKLFEAMKSFQAKRSAAIVLASLKQRHQKG